jgi:hypothetical protein
MVELNRIEERKKTRRLNSGVYDLKSFTGIPHQSPDCYRDRGFPCMSVGIGIYASIWEKSTN